MKRYTKYVLTRGDIRNTWDEVFDNLGEKFSRSHTEGEVILWSNTLKDLNKDITEQYKKPLIGMMIRVCKDTDEDSDEEDEANEDQTVGEEELVITDQRELIGNLYASLEKAKTDFGAGIVSVNVIIEDEAITLTVENAEHRSNSVPMMGEQEGEQE